MNLSEIGLAKWGELVDTTHPTRVPSQVVGRSVYRAEPQTRLRYTGQAGFLIPTLPPLGPRGTEAATTSRLGRPGRRTDDLADGGDVMIVQTSIDEAGAVTVSVDSDADQGECWSTEVLTDIITRAGAQCIELWHATRVDVEEPEDATEAGE